VICETKCIWSRYLLLDREKSHANVAPSLRKGAGPLQPIDGPMQFCRTEYPAPWHWSAALTMADARLQGLSTACWSGSEWPAMGSNRPTALSGSLGRPRT
jgi:hypothetical protein